MIVVTGAAGMIGSNITADLEAADLGPVVACDWLGTGDKWRNLAKRQLSAVVNPEDLSDFLGSHADQIRAVIHMGAISATTERDADRLVRLNINSTVSLWDWCAAQDVPFIYGSSAATYGGTEDSFADDDSLVGLGTMRPLNAYGWSKKATDDVIARRVAEGEPLPPQWVGLKFFNVYGPNEYHKDDMRSVVSKMYDAVSAGETIRLFRSERGGVANGDQRRDFVYVKDCSQAVVWLLENPDVSGIFNLGTGRAQSFLEMFRGLEAALGRSLPMEFIEMPPELRGRYQYFTQADMTKFRAAGLPIEFRSLEDGIQDYVARYLTTSDPYR